MTKSLRSLGLHVAVLALALPFLFSPCYADRHRHNGKTPKSIKEHIQSTIHHAGPQSIYEKHTAHTNLFPLAELRKELVSEFPYVHPRAGSDGKFYTKIAILETQVCWQDVKSPIPWMELMAGGSQHMHYAFPHWSVNTGKCLGIDRQGLQSPQYAKLVVVECASSNQVLIFSDVKNGGTIRLLTDPDKCLSAHNEQGVLEFRPCSEVEGKSEFLTVHRMKHEGEHHTREGGYHISPQGDHKKCISVRDGNKYKNGAQFAIKDCTGNAAPLGFMETKEHLQMDLVLRPQVVDFAYTSLGVTFMGNPGVQLQWDAKHMVMYPWKDNHCDDGCHQPVDCDPSSCVVECEFADRTSLCDGVDINGKRLEKMDSKNYHQTAKDKRSLSNHKGKNGSRNGKGTSATSRQAGDDCKVKNKKSVVHNARTESKRESKYNAASRRTRAAEYNQGIHPHHENRDVDVEYLGFNTSFDIANELIQATYGHDHPGPNLGLGKDCTGRCLDTSAKNPCSCGTSMSPGCQFQEGYDCMADTTFIPDSTIFVGCNTNHAQCTPEKTTGTYLPLLIPSGLNLRTCPDNVLDGQRVWGGGNDEVESKNTAQCEMNENCTDEPFVGTMSLSGVKYTFCCPGETSDPFSPLSYGFFGVFPENGHFGPPGMECGEHSCTYRPVCGCPTAIPALNIKVSGPGRSFPKLVVPANEAYSVPVQEDSEKADIVIAPSLVGNSTLRVYTVFKGSDDSFTAGDYVVFNDALVESFIDECSKRPCNERGNCADVSIDWYQTNTDPYALDAAESTLKQRTQLHFNPTKEWNVRKSPSSIFDNRKIVLAPSIENGHLWMGPVFIGHPGKTYIGSDPDLQGIFTSVFGRPVKGPGSAPGGTTSMGLERFKALMQCKLSMYSGTEKDPRIVY